jgi:hypothetical protein
MRPHTAIYVSSYCCICVLILLYMCPHTAIKCVLILLHMRCSAPEMRASSTCTAPSASAARRFTRKRQHECRRPATKRLRGVSICTFVRVTQAKVSTEKQRLELAARC